MCKKVSIVFFKDKRKDAVKKVIAAMTVGKDVSSLFTDVVNCMQTESLELKKLVYLYLINYAKSQPDLAVLAVNTFVKVTETLTVDLGMTSEILYATHNIATGSPDDSQDPNPLIRALAVRTMGCIRVDKITEYLCDPLQRCLKDARQGEVILRIFFVEVPKVDPYASLAILLLDRDDVWYPLGQRLDKLCSMGQNVGQLKNNDDDPYVRKTASICVAKLYGINAELVEDRGFVEILKDLISDNNPMVVANAVAALAEIQEHSNRPVLEVTTHTISKLLTALNECNEKYVLQIMITPTPITERPATPLAVSGRYPVCPSV
ncbi:hypothetical protein ACLOJK_007950 [Asimina triloba]